MKAAPMPCPACHHLEHDPGSCPECPRCELHVDEALIWVSRVAREDYDEFVEGIEREAIEAIVEDAQAEGRAQVTGGPIASLALIAFGIVIGLVLGVVFS